MLKCKQEVLLICQLWGGVRSEPYTRWGNTVVECCLCVCALISFALSGERIRRGRPTTRAGWAAPGSANSVLWGRLSRIPSARSRCGAPRWRAPSGASTAPTPRI